MTRPSFPTFIVLALAFLGLHPLRADTLSILSSGANIDIQTYSTAYDSPSTQNWNGNRNDNIPLFDSSLGTLTRVDILLRGAMVPGSVPGEGAVVYDNEFFDGLSGGLNTTIVIAADGQLANPYDLFGTESVSDTLSQQEPVAADEQWDSGPDFYGGDTVTYTVPDGFGASKMVSFSENLSQFTKGSHTTYSLDVDISLSLEMTYQDPYARFPWEAYAGEWKVSNQIAAQAYVETRYHYDPVGMEEVPILADLDVDLETDVEEDLGLNIIASAGTGAVEVTTDMGHEVIEMSDTTGNMVSLGQQNQFSDDDFSISFNYRFATDTGFLKVVVDGVVLDTIEAPSTIDLGYLNYSKSFEGLGIGLHSWELRLTNNEDPVVYLDDLQIGGQAVPEPGAVVLLLATAAACLLPRRRP